MRGSTCSSIIWCSSRGTPGIEKKTVPSVSSMKRGSFCGSVYGASSSPLARGSSSALVAHSTHFVPRPVSPMRGDAADVDKTHSGTFYIPQAAAAALAAPAGQPLPSDSLSAASSTIEQRQAAVRMFLQTKRDYLDSLLNDFVAQKRMKISTGDYEPCYVIK